VGEATGHARFFEETRTGQGAFVRAGRRSEVNEFQRDISLERTTIKGPVDDPESTPADLVLDVIAIRKDDSRLQAHVNRLRVVRISRGWRRTCLRGVFLKSVISDVAGELSEQLVSKQFIALAFVLDEGGALIGCLSQYRLK
jgi:hypothetical protein